MTGYDFICESISIFENSIQASGPDGQSADHPIRSVNELARRTGYSVWHFTRLFSAVAGTSPKEYLRGRILTVAALKVAEARLPLALIASEAGYPDYESFSRAFKKHFLLTPKQLRILRHVPSGVMPRLVPRKSGGCARLAAPEPELLWCDPFTLAGLPFHIAPGTVSFHAQWASFMAIHHRVAGRKQPETFCQFSSWTDDEAFGGMSVLCALETEAGSRQEPLFTVREIPRSRYVRFIHDGDISTIGATYRYIYCEWLASHEVRPADFWEFQRYPDAGARTEIWIPLAPDQ